MTPAEMVMRVKNPDFKMGVLDYFARKKDLI